MPETSDSLAPVARRQIMITALIVVLVSALLLAAYFWLRPHFVVMFRDLKPQDASSIVAQLEHDKTPYRLEDSGATILVPDSEVHAARLRIMSEDVPLRGTVGFELFNNSDLGLTEFAQKVNYQRALQGELARTIMSLKSVASARVHLSFPENTLFRKNAGKPKASVAITPREDELLSPESIRGIQRLVAAAVPDLEAADVTIVDQSGASMVHADSGVGMVDDPQLQFKMELEGYYRHKLLDALEPILGKNKVLVSVDASINFDQVRVTQESNDARGLAGAGQHDLQTGKSGATALSADLDAPSMTETSIKAAPSTNAEHEHSSHRLEQIVSAPGSIRRLSVGLLLLAPIDSAMQARLNELAATAVGAVPSRGDVVSVFVQNHPLDASQAPKPDTLQLQPSLSSESTASQTIKPESAPSALPLFLNLMGALLLCVVVGLVVFWVMRRQRGSMTAVQRATHVARIKRLLAEEQNGEANVA